MTPGAIELIALCAAIVAAFIGLIWAYENWPRRVVIDEQPHGDATETPQKKASKVEPGSKLAQIRALREANAR